MPVIFCGICSAMTSPAKAEDGLCPKCIEKCKTQEEREAAAILRAEKGNKAAISWLESHGFSQE